MSNQRVSNSRAWRNSFAKKTKRSGLPSQDHSHSAAKPTRIPESPSQTVSFELLPFELFCRICSFLYVRDIIALRKCSKLFLQWTRDHAIWHQLLEVYCSLMQFSLQSFIHHPLECSSSKLEWIASCHLRFAQYMSASGSKVQPTKEYTLPTSGITSFKSIYPLRYCLVVIGRSVLECWDLGFSEGAQPPKQPVCAYHIDISTDEPNSWASIQHYCFTGPRIYFSARLYSIVNGSFDLYGRIFIFELCVDNPEPHMRLCTIILDSEKRLETEGRLLAYPNLFFTTHNPYRFGSYNVESRKILTWFSKPYHIPTFFYLNRNNSHGISLESVSRNLHVYSLPDAELESMPLSSDTLPVAEPHGYQLFDSVFAGLDRKMPHSTFTARFSADIGSALTKFDVRGYLPPPSSRPKDAPRHVIRRMQVVPNPDSSDLEAPYRLEIVDTQTCPILQWHSGDSQVLPGGRRWLWFIDNSATNVRSGKGRYIFKVHSSHVAKGEDASTESHTLFPLPSNHYHSFRYAFSPFMGRACMIQDGKLVVKEFVPLPKPVVPEGDVDSDWDSSD
ncbi:hypothetical protein DL96DRAFT_1822153 [Flagelloscypha sp. PMI_526]|nr:hypothetical protein DL96DRAFT_1822153 [Flagelloscypha sp. PMI_526]